MLALEKEEQVLYHIVLFLKLTPGFHDINIDGGCFISFCKLCACYNYILDSRIKFVNRCGYSKGT